MPLNHASRANSETPNETVILALSAAIDANTANAAALKTALDNAVNPPTPEPPAA